MGRVETAWGGGEVPPGECHLGGTAATGWALLGTGDAEFFHLLLQSGTLHSQAGRGTLRTPYHPADFAKDAEDVPPFGVCQGDRLPGRHVSLRGRGLQVAERDPERRARGENDRPFNDVLHLPDVARPG